MFRALLFAFAPDWTAIDLPAACIPAARAPLCAVLADGSHLRAAELPQETGETTPLLPFATFAQMLEEDLKSRGLALEMSRSSGALLARGDDAALARAKEFGREVDAALGALEIQLEVTITAADASTPARTLRRTVRSGELVFLGTRAVQDYVASFDVEVAADSGSSEPVVGQTQSGVGLHVRASRVAQGSRVHVWALFDGAEVEALTAFDPGTNDLGVLQQPRVPLVQLAFSGFVTGDAALAARVRSTSPVARDFVVEIRARTRPDGEMAGWVPLDLAFVGGAPPPLAACTPGSGLARQARFTTTDVAPGALPPSAVASALQGSRSKLGTKSAPPFWTETLLFVPRAEAASLAEALSLVRAAEALRSDAGTLVVESGGLRAELPSTSAAPARLLCGVQTAYLVDYRLELAPQIWMPAPLVETAFDGLCLEGWVAAGTFTCSAWLAESGPVRDVPRDEAQVGRMQALSRSLHSTAGRVTSDDREGGGLLALDLGGTTLALHWKR